MAADVEFVDWAGARSVVSAHTGVVTMKGCTLEAPRPGEFFLGFSRAIEAGSGAVVALQVRSAQA
jgi:hypothetical protein